MKRACVIGWPISHSRSPLIHNHWLKRYGIDGAYDKQAIKPQDLEEFLSTLASRGYAGCNVTIPHKEAAFSLSQPDDLARRLGAANTLYLENGKLCSTSTDGEGFMASLRMDVPDLVLSGNAALILGAGGAARAIILALLDAGIGEIRLANRTRERSDELARQFGPRVKPANWEERDQHLGEADLLVNTTSLGMKGQPELNLPLERLAPRAAVSDLVYVPLKTRLIEQAEQRGNPVSAGLGMLLHQAVRGFELWFGTRPVVTPELRELVEADVRSTA